MTRLNKYIAQAGIASRRHADDLISRGCVRVNGRVVRELGKVVQSGDRVEVGGKLVAPDEKTYLMVNKPVGVVTTMRDPEGRRTVAELVPRDLPRVVPVGRLDYDTAGVLLLTNDGGLAHRLLHPRFGVEKTYRATIGGRLSREDVARLQGGMDFDAYKAGRAKVRVVAVRGDRCVVDLSIHEGRNRQVRTMFEALGHPVYALVRLRFGPLSLGNLPTGSVRPLTPKELRELRHVGNDSVESRRSKGKKAFPVRDDVR
jgi:23S rRNA pseudouridine2605 synthase